VGALLSTPYGRRQATYDLRRLKRKGLVEKIPHAHRYRLTSLGRRVAVLFTKTYSRVLAPGLGALDLGLPEEVIERNELSTAWRSFDGVLDAFIQRQLIAA
jgi:predicted MarR family transcription regulator